VKQRQAWLGVVAVMSVLGPGVGDSRSQAAPPSPDADFAQEPVVVERLRTTCRFEADGTGSNSVAGRVSIRNESGLKAFGQIAGNYDAGFETLTIKGRVVKPDGAATEIPQSAVQDVSSPVLRLAPIYSDIREKHLVVPGLGVGDILEYEMQVVRFAAPAPGHFWSTFQFNRRLIVKDEELRLDLPSGKYVNVKTRPGLAADVKEAGGRRVSTWKSSHLVREDAGKAARPEKPTSFETAEEEPDVQISTFRTWAEIGDWYAGLESDRRVPDTAIRAKVGELVQGKTTDVAKHQAIYNYVAQKYRYVGLMFGLGRYQPHAASEIYANQYGDCKDKHTLLAAMGEAAGLQIKAALTSATRKVDPTFPSPDQFDHVISYAKVSGTDMWFDTTSEVAPFRMLLPNIRGKSALIVSPGGKSELASIPREPVVPNATATEVEGAIDDHGTLDVDVRITLRGDLELISRIAFRTLPAAQWKDLLVPLASVNGLGEGELSNVQMSELSNPDVPLQMTFHVKNSNFFNRFESAPRLELPFGQISMGRPEQSNSAPIRLGIRKEEYRAKLSLPLQFVPRPPLPVALKRDYAEYTSRYALDGDSVSAERILIVKVEELPAERQNDLEALQRAIATDLDQAVVVKNAGSVGPEGLTGKSEEKIEASRTAYASGNYLASAELAESVVKAEPSHKEAYADLGRAYLALGDFHKAQTALTRAVQLNPYSPDAFGNLGILYAAMERNAEAEKAFRRQAEINPLDARAHGLLGHFLLEQKQYAEAASELEKATSVDPHAALFVDLGQARVHLDRTQQAQEAFDRALELSPTPSVQNEIAAALAMHKTGLDRAREVALSAEATLTARLRDVSLEDLKRQDLSLVKLLGDCWDNLGLVELQAGHTAAAERYLAAAWELTQNGIVAHHLGQLYERAGKRAQAIDYYAFATASPRPEPASRARLAALMGPNGFAGMVTEKRNLLGNLRSFPVPGARGDGTGEFFVMLTADAHVEAVRFASGDASVKPLAEALKKIPFKLTLPDDTDVRLFRRGILVCLPAGKTSPASCDFILIPPDAVRSLN
jgi:tetratricopeptide (TPR) repeat protein